MRQAKDRAEEDRALKLKETERKREKQLANLQAEKEVRHRLFMGSEKKGLPLTLTLIWAKSSRVHIS